MRRPWPSSQKLLRKSPPPMILALNECHLRGIDLNKVRRQNKGFGWRCFVTTACDKHWGPHSSEYRLALGAGPLASHLEPPKNHNSGGEMLLYATLCWQPLAITSQTALKDLDPSSTERVGAVSLWYVPTSSQVSASTAHPTKKDAQASSASSTPSRSHGLSWLIGIVLPKKLGLPTLQGTWEERWWRQMY